MNRPSATLVTLANGLRAVLARDDHAESVAFGLFVASGSRHERPKDAGISHFIEHMLFKGTPTRTPRDITRAIEGRGGNLNACTSESVTCYYAHLPCEYLSEAVDILGDMYLNAAFPADEFAREKQVVIEEIRMYADEPDSVALENLQRRLFPKNALGAPVAGTPASLAPMTPDDLRRYVRTHYVPAATVAVVVGNFDPDAAARLLERHFGGIRRRSAAPAATPVDFSVPIATGDPVARDIHQTQLALGYRTFGACDPRRYAAAVMDAVLGRGMSSRLFQEVREKRGLSYDIGSRMQFFDEAGMYTVTAGLDPAKAEKALATVDRELSRLCERRVGAAELGRTKEFLSGNFRLGHERVTSRLFFYGGTLMTYGRLVSPQEQVEGILAVTAEDIRAVACDIFRPEARCVSWVVPRRAGAGAEVRSE